MSERSLSAGVKAIRDAVRGEFEIECETCHGSGCDDCGGDGSTRAGFGWSRPLWKR